jgi:hypothetical protein
MPRRITYPLLVNLYPRLVAHFAECGTVQRAVRLRRYDADDFAHFIVKAVCTGVLLSTLSYLMISGLKTMYRTPGVVYVHQKLAAKPLKKAGPSRELNAGPHPYEINSLRVNHTTRPPGPRKTS